MRKSITLKMDSTFWRSGWRRSTAGDLVESFNCRLRKKNLYTWFESGATRIRATDASRCWWSTKWRTREDLLCKRKCGVRLVFLYCFIMSETANEFDQSHKCGIGGLIRHRFRVWYAGRLPKNSNIELNATKNDCGIALALQIIP